MYQLIFRDWKIALLWAIGLTASTADTAKNPTL